jgi:hypothetical protein
MKEKRIHRRFEANLPARIEALTVGKIRVLNVETKDISASGAFIYTKEYPFFPDGTRFIMNLIIPENSIDELAYLKSFVECEGFMERYNSEGMAIYFDKRCQTMRLMDYRI